MQKARLALCFFVLASALWSAPARAAGAGCEVYTTGIAGSHGSCRFFATGPTTYSVRTTSGFLISASSDGGSTWRTVVSQIGVPEQPASAVAVKDGALNVKAGDLVDAAIGYALWTPPSTPANPNPATIRYQDGYIKAGTPT